MEWHSLYKPDRIDTQESPTSNVEVRNSYQRDYDRIIFSSAFRRLQNKTQVFPLPGAVMVHNRLTHSLEVSSVGRSLAKMTGEHIARQWNDAAFKDFYAYEFPSVVAAACLAHDIGNPPFGHSGEEAIRAFFQECSGDFKNLFNEELSHAERKDFLKFEGNANAFRTLTHSFNEDIEGGYRLTLTTLASIVKYPCDSESGFNKQQLTTKKSGFFQSEIGTFTTIADAFRLPKLSADKNVYARHPFVFLVEAADDICYRIMDFEDAFKLNIVSSTVLFELFLGFFNSDQQDKVNKRLNGIVDENQKVQYLRAVVINYLVEKVTNVFLSNEVLLLNGRLEHSLIDLLPEADRSIIEKIDDFSREKIYSHSSVIEIEIAGHNVIGGLLDEFCSALASPTKSKSKKLLQLIPKQFTIRPENSFYSNLQSIVDFIAGMTDLYAVEMYKNIKGISLSQLK